MRYYGILAFLLFTLSFLRADAAIFTVISNADSGPGTLREALTLAAANGSAEKDFIYFNLPDLSEAGRTITVATQLPNLSSNLTIDGTTQNGPPFGKSDAKIKISTTYRTVDITSINLLQGNGLEGLEIYGLYLYDFTDISTIRSGIKDRNGLVLDNSVGIKIGAPGKGNLISGFNLYCISIAHAENTKVQSNIIGLNKFNSLGNEGEDAGTGTGVSGIIQIDAGVLSYVGGNIPNQGNTIFTYIDLGYQQQSTGTTFIWSNNLWVFQNGTTTSVASQEARPIITFHTAYTFNATEQQKLDFAGTVGLDISNNTAAGSTTVLDFRYLLGEIWLKGNNFNIAKGGNTEITSNDVAFEHSNPIHIENCLAQLNVGGEDLAFRNAFNKVDVAVSAVNSPNVYLMNNEFKCIGIAAYTNNISNNAYTLPYVTIDAISTNGNKSIATGTARPESYVDIHSSESCNNICSIRNHIQRVFPDAQGKWQAEFLDLNGIFYVAATTGNQTSLYKTFEINSQNATIQQIRCSDIASVTGLQVPVGLTYYWADAEGNILSRDLDFKTQTAGKYTLVLGNGCITREFDFEDHRVRFDDTHMVVKKDVCSASNGSIKDLRSIDPDNKINQFEWTNQDLKLVGNTANLENLPVGYYTLKISTSDGCEKTYGPIVIENETAPTIDQSNSLRTDATCDNYDGSIKGLKVSPGDFTYFWTDENGKVFPTDGPDLDYVPAGTYTLNVKYGECRPLQSQPITIQSINGVSLITTNIAGKTDQCNGNTGEITGLQALGATTFEWRNTADNSIAGHALDLKNVTAGHYKLTYSNASCSRYSEFDILAAPPTVFPVFAATITRSCDAFPTGTITVNTDNSTEQPVLFRWVNSKGDNVGFDKTVQFLPEGTYKLYLTDKNYCENPYGEYTVQQYPAFSITGFGTVTNTQCGVGYGNISAVTVAGGTGIYMYQWMDAASNVIGAQSSITNLAPGKYKLRITDGGCNLAEVPYNVIDVAATPPPPMADNVVVNNDGDGSINVTDAFLTAIYRLYDTGTSLQPVAESIGGKFSINSKTDRSYFISLTYGYCESTRTEVKASVGVLADAIPNTFTPNGDGVNDKWIIKGLDGYVKPTISIFNRNGQLIFQSTGYANPFDGTFKGKQLPAAVYYYIIDLKNNNRLSGNLTILR